MWRMTPRLATATLTATLALALGTSPRSEAASVQSYSYTTSGNISGMSGIGPIELSGSAYSQSSFTTPGSIVLGQFTTLPLPTTATLTYNNTPFTIDLNVNPTGSPNYYYYTSPSAYQYVVSGVLNGTISGDGTSSMMASVTSITGSGSGLNTTPPFPFSSILVNTQGIAAPNGYTDGVTTLTANVSIAGTPLLPAPAPEPSTIAVFGLALAGWTFRRHRASKAAKSA